MRLDTAPFPHNVVLVSGSRDLNYDSHYETIAYWLEQSKPDIVIQGGAKGADALAKLWSDTHGIHCATVEALWDRYSYGAGPRRNAAMLLLRPNVLLAFPSPNSKGTRDQIRQARELDDIEIRVVEIREGFTVGCSSAR